MTINRTLLSSLISFVAFVVVALMPYTGRAGVLEDLGVTQGYAMDFDTGTVLWSKNPDEKMPTSSMSKVMTMFVVFDALKADELTLDQSLPVSEKAWRMQGSKMFVHVGDQVRVEDLIRGVIIQSGNDATVVLAEGLSGSEEAFAQRMNKKAQELGMTNTHFMNASGWPDPEHYSTARDLTILARALIKTHPDFYKYYSEKEFTYNNIKQGNRNPLLYRNIGADGVKTGHTEAAGYGLIGSGMRDGRRVVFVINGTKSMQARADESARLMEYTLANFINLSPYSNGREVTTAKVALGQSATVPLVLGQDGMMFTVPKGAGVDFKITAAFKEPLMAPVKKGDDLGTLTLDSGNGGIPVQLPLVAGADVPQMGFFARTMAKTMYRLTGKGI